MLILRNEKLQLTMLDDGHVILEDRVVGCAGR